ncbi:MAG: uracil-DNA glycosylase [Woeseiaceae bacterium]
MTSEARRLEYLAALGIDVFTPRTAAFETTGAESSIEGSSEGATEGPATPVESDAGVSRQSGSPTESLDWPELEARVAACTLCSLHQGRTQTVFGVGNRTADWMIVGEAPGAEEDRRGEPFVGRAGKLLDEMLRAIGLSRETVFIANILKCRPPNNRDPAATEAAACRSYLDRQIELVQPRIILAVGRIAAQQLLGSDETVGRLRGRVHLLHKPEIPVVVTYHPAYLLRTPGQKREAWKDLCLARQTIGARAT